MLIKFYEVSLERLRKKRDQYINRLGTGSAQSFEEYRLVCGKISGLSEAEGILLDLFKDMQDPPRKPT